MFDIRAIRDNPDAFRAAFERKQKGLGEIVSQMLDHDKAVRKAVSDKQDAESARNAKSKEIGKAKASGDEALFEQLRAEVAQAKDVIEAAGEQEAAAREELDKLLYGTPNIPMPDVPEGEDEDSNQEQHKWGEPNKYLAARNNVLDHADLGAALKNNIDQPLMDFEAAAKMSGARFVALRGNLARLERALATFMLDQQTLENGYEEVSPPFLVREEALVGTGQLPKFEEDLFQAQSFDTEALVSAATSRAEVSIADFGEQIEDSIEPGTPYPEAIIGITRSATVVIRQAIVNSILDGASNMTDSGVQYLIPTSEVRLPISSANKLSVQINYRSV